MSENLNGLETGVLKMLLAGPGASMEVLRQQAKTAAVTDRTLSGKGFLTQMEVPEHIVRLANPPSFDLGDVEARLRGVEGRVGFVLFVRAGTLSLLEGYTYGEAWPEVTEILELRYWKPHTDELRRVKLIEC